MNIILPFRRFLILDFYLVMLGGNMAIFDYKGQDARKLISDAWTISAYTNGIAAAGELYKIPSLVVDNATNNFLPPAGWRELTPSELGLSEDRLDITGSFKGESLLGSQAKILGEFNDSGALVKVAFSVAGTSSVLDLVPGYVEMANGTYINSFEYLLSAVKDYAVGNGLGGSDVVVTGYSLGAAAVNNFYTQRESLSDGFYKDASFVSAESPVISDGEGVFNFGFENDVVYRAVGDDAQGPVPALLNALTGNDTSYVSTTDNIVLFDTLYSLPVWPYGVFSVANLTGWSAHVGGVFTNPIQRIGESSFYDYIERDSVVVLSNLDAVSRLTSWVSDKDTSTSNHYGKPAFLLGTENGDKLQDGAGDDFLDGFQGSDQFRLSTGTDLVAGGVGEDKVYLSGDAANYEAVRLNDGTLFLYDSSGKYGLKELSGVETVEFETETVTTLSTLPIIGNIIKQVSTVLTPSYDVSGSKLESNALFGRDKEYQSSIQGVEGNDTLAGSSQRDLIFGLDGDDSISGLAGNDLLHGGLGNDLLFGGAGSDQLFGGAGDDRLVGGVGDDYLSGGVGSDIFSFGSRGFGNDVITDFNIHGNGVDIVEFSSSVFATEEEVLGSIVQGEEGAFLSVGDGSITFIGVAVEQISAQSFVIS
ncbi:calcium-binding protein [Pseudomonas aeruginosa]|uniref:calcium-binding protein n=1 Tax=Pseudomonas aeruginosa TaxID=287 RepID=UPI00289EA72B|nr:calcium-binding protein [Pseudomonas aeruginosa]